jgi:prepilin-type processing-associated H-X9-DG protein
MTPDETSLPPGNPQAVDNLAVFHSNKGTLSFADGHAVLFKWRDEATIRMGRLAAQGQTASFGPGCLGPTDARFMAAGYVCAEWPPAWLRDIR